MSSGRNRRIVRRRTTHHLATAANGSELDEREAVIEFNRQREKTFSQKMAEAEELETIERARARERSIANLKCGDEKPEREMLPAREEGRTRDRVASAIGIGSGRTYDKAAKVWEAAKAGHTSASIPGIGIAHLRPLPNAHRGPSEASLAAAWVI